MAQVQRIKLMFADAQYLTSGRETPEGGACDGIVSTIPVARATFVGGRMRCRGAPDPASDRFGPWYPGAESHVVRGRA